MDDTDGTEDRPVRGGDDVASTELPDQRPIAPSSRQDVEAPIDEWLRYRKEHDIRLDGLTIRELIEEGRRY